jgi:hypothetical protein
MRGGSARNETDQAAFSDSYDDFVRWLPETEVEQRLEDERRTLSTRSSTVLSIQYLERWSATTPSRGPRCVMPTSACPSPATRCATRCRARTRRRPGRAWYAGCSRASEETKGASEASIRNFARSYARAYDAAWERFLLNTPIAPAAGGAIKDSPYHALLRRVSDEMKVELPRDGTPPPAWVGMLAELCARRRPRREGRAKDGASAAPAAVEPLSGRASRRVAKEVEVAQQSPSDALKIAVELTEQHPSSFQKAIDEIRAIVPSGDPAMRAKLVEILEVPVHNALATVLAAAVSELDQEWRNAIAVPFGGGARRGAHAGALRSNGALRQFHEAWLAPFLRAGVPRALVRDAADAVRPALPGLARRGGPHAGDAPRRMRDRRSRCGSSGIPVARDHGQRGREQARAPGRVLRISCYSLEYRRDRAHTIAWTTAARR